MENDFEKDLTTVLKNFFKGLEIRHNVEMARNIHEQLLHAMRVSREKVSVSSELAISRAILDTKP